jgi:hypothetical protein
MSEWLVTPKDVVLAAQIFSLLHLPLWITRHTLNSPRHERIRRHVRSGHGEHFTHCSKCL